MSFFDFYRTDWHFVTSLGADYLISQGVLVLGGAGGYIYLKNRRTQKQIALHCHEFEVGVSVSPRWFRLPDIDFELAAGVPRLAGGSIRLSNFLVQVSEVFWREITILWIHKIWLDGLWWAAYRVQQLGLDNYQLSISTFLPLQWRLALLL
jgi:hypothetical protein